MSVSTFYIVIVINVLYILLGNVNECPEHSLLKTKILETLHNISRKKNIGNNLWL